MKKAILPLIIFSIIISSCSKNEDNSEIEEQINLSSSPLVGSWKYFGYTDVGNGSDELRDNDECEDNNVYVFKGDGTYEYRAYQLSLGECVVRVNQTGTWKSITEGTAELTYVREPEPYVYELEYTISGDVLGITDVDGGNVFSRKYRLQ